MADFEQAFVATMKQETPYIESGGLITFSPVVIEDSGGITKFGVSQKAHPDVDVKSLTISQAQTIFRQYWTQIVGDSISSQANANNYFDHAVNAGSSTAKSLAIQALRKMGSQISESAGFNAVAKEINRYTTNFNKFFGAEREAYYKSLAKADPRNADSLEGWLSRAQDFFISGLPSVLAVSAVCGIAIVMFYVQSKREVG